MSLFVNDVATIKTSGQINGVERTITAGATGWDLAKGNNWTVGAIVVPQPTNGVVGQSGTLTITAPPISWPASGALKYPNSGEVPAPSSFPAVLAFYVKSQTEVLLGEVTQGIV